MKVSVKVFIVIISLLPISCEKIDELLTFEIKDSVEFTIPSFTSINSPISVPVPPVESSSSQSFENNNTKASLVKNVVLKELNLTIIDPAGKNFTFLKSIEIYISAENVKEVLLASKYDIPEDIGNVLLLDTSGEKLDEYIKKGQYNLRTLVQVKEIPGKDVTVAAESTFRVTADPL